MTIGRLIAIVAAASLVAGQGLTAAVTAASAETPAPHPTAAAQPGKDTKSLKRKQKPAVVSKKRPGQVPLRAPAPRALTLTPSPPPAPPVVPMPAAETAATTPLDINAVKQAIDLVRKSRADEATNAEKSISDPVARKVVEWVILRSDETTVDFSRYASFIAANPSWPSIITLRRHAEAALWEQQVDPQTTIGFFAHEAPLSGKGYFALARAFLIKGDSAHAYAMVSTAWRETGFSADVESQARQMFAGLITPADDKARMDARLYVRDNDAALRAASHLDAAELAIAKARATVNVNPKSANAKTLVAAVPAAAQHDPGYMFSRIQWLRHGEKIKEAVQLMQAVPRDPAKLINLDEWWIERRLLARKLLDLGDAKAAYEMVNDAAPPPNENYRADREFTAGWIALEFLHQPSLALPHFARITEGVVNPITLARSYYWQGRSAQALGLPQEAREAYQNAARYPTAYYGQLARAQLHLDDSALRDASPPPGERRPLELGRALEILYAADERDLVAIMAADVADKTSDPAGLATLAEITASHNDARATLLIGKTALGRGFAFAHYAFPDFGIPEYRQIGPQVERCVVYAIVRQESAFNPRVVSSAHAYGLMQVTPEAGRNTARKFKVPFDQRRLLGDIPYNAQLGTAELGADINAYRGSYILAFVAYNAGPGRAAQWIAQYGDPRNPKVDPIDWIERIPISETRYYVQRVLENMQVYRARLENNPNLLIEADMRRGS